MKNLRNMLRKAALVMTVLLLSLVVFGAYNVSTQGNRWFSSSANTHLRELRANATAGNVYDRMGVLLATTDINGKRIYNPDSNIRRSMVHVLGDRQNNVGYGVEAFMANRLYGFDTSPLVRLTHAIRGEKLKGKDLRLTVDSNLSSRIARFFPKGHKGACVVMNYRTGEVLSLLSFPNFDPDNITEATKQVRNRPFWNNATRWVSAPGSTFKVITLASSLQNINNIENETLNCSGIIEFPGGRHNLLDAGKAVHGDISLKQAFTKSCNVVFGSLALRLGDAQLSNTAAAFGIGDYFLFRDFVVENSSYPKHNRTQSEIAWTGVGQSALQISPLHMCMIASSIANGGDMMEPQLLLREINPNNEVKEQFSPRVYKKALSKEHAQIISDYMYSVVQSGTGTGARVKGYRICGKTGSSEIDNQEKSNAWFIGFIDEENYPYAVCVAVMNAGSAGMVAAPLAGEIFKAILGVR